MKRILFVCTGNTCRSPMAAAIARHKASCDSTEIICESAGLAAAEGQPASLNAVIVCDEIGIDLHEHRSRQVTGEMLNSSDLIVCMSPSHAAALRLYADKVLVLGGGIVDPYGGNVAVYRNCRDRISAAIDEIWEQLK